MMIAHAHKRLAGTTTALLLAVALTGCHKTRSADTVASVNGKAIMRTELENAFKTQQQQNPQQDMTADQTGGEKLALLRQLIDSEIIDQRAAKMNLTATNEEVDAKVNEIKARYSEEQFNAQLKANNHTIDDLKREIRRSLTVDKLLNKEINSKINITDADVSTYYQKHKSDYNLIETTYHLGQVVVTSMPTQQQQAGNLQGSKASNEVEAKRKIQALKNRLDSGEDFGAIAMNFSENPQTAANGGDMGYVPESQLHADPQVFAAVAKLKDGQITDIIPMYAPNSQGKQIIGYAILKLFTREPAGQRSLQDPTVQQNIRQQLRDARSNLLKSAYFESLRNEAKVENYLAEEILKNYAK